jgi:hypothetical protein
MVGSSSQIEHPMRDASTDRLSGADLTHVG